MSRRMCFSSTGITISGELSCGKWPSVDITSTTESPPTFWWRYSATTMGTAKSFLLWMMWHGTVTRLRISRMSLWKMVCNTLSAMSGRILNKVRLNSCTATDSMSPPTAIGANPEHHAL
ncbi:hypothetical protein V8G54_003007 [Vigna mungo]|uniref:Uncharacterized protein n=1 Tax=Vigna mungo TaxID=3915 RepID=A0AAQ3PA81_VIGMU